MQKIHFLGNKKRVFTRHYHPIHAFKNELLNAGISCKFYSNPLTPGIEECDVLVFFDASYRDILPIKSKERQAALDFLSGYLENFERVIWFDDRDSAGNLRTYIFPLVDKYAKSQLLSDISYYQKQKKFGVLHRDFVYENYQIDDEINLKGPFYKGPLSQNDLSKLCLGWNLSLINWAYHGENNILKRKLISKRNRNYNIKFSYPDLCKRSIDISYRVNMWNNLPTVGWWRKTTYDYLEKYKKKHPDIKMNSYGYFNKKQYMHEMQNAIISPSPFGFGEICYRDFESFVNGALLLKPDMGHLQTWPDFYEDGRTFVAHKWDFSDFEEKLENILYNPKMFEPIAHEGQNKLHEAFTYGEKFVDQLLCLIS